MFKSYKFSTLKQVSASLIPFSSKVTAFVFSSYIYPSFSFSFFAKRSASIYKLADSILPPEIINGVLASSINTESTSSIITKLDNEAGYSVYTAGAATSVPWSGVTNAPTKVSQFTNDAGYLTSVPAQTWKSITGKPSVYPPSQHNHPSSNINTLTGYSKPTTTSAIVTSDSLNAALGKLEFALDNKVNTSQLDNYLPLSGGTVTGTLKLRSSFYSKLILDNTDGDNKYQFIEFMQQGTSYGKLGTMGDDLKQKLH